MADYIHSGDILWHRDFDEPIWTSYLLEDESILVHLELSIVRLANDGTEQWRFGHNEIITQVTLNADRILVRDFEEQQFFLALPTGSLLPNAF